jgi:hypothetical protein
LTGIWLAVVIARLGLSEGGVRSPAAWVAGTVGFVAALLLWARHADHRAQDAASGTDALFACATTLPRAALAQVPQFQERLRRVRLAWSVGGWLSGRLEITPATVRWVPSAWTRRLFRAPSLELPWSDVQEVAVVEHPGPRQPAVLGLRLQNGSACSFLVTRRDELRGTLRAHRQPSGEIPLADRTE